MGLKKVPTIDEGRSRTMRAVRSKNTTPETTVRRIVSQLGYRFRIHFAELPGSPDIVLPIQQKTIFVHGCFWHQHHCKRGNRIPKANSEYWKPKLERNKERDRKNIRALRRSGWRVLQVWECQLSKPEQLTRRLSRFLED